MSTGTHSDVGPRPKPSGDVTPENLFAFARHVMNFDELVELIADFYEVDPKTLMCEGIKPKGPKGRAREMVCFFSYRLWAVKGGPGSFYWIKRKLGYADKTGPYRAYRRIETRAKEGDAAIRDEIQTIEQRLIVYLRERMEK